MRTSIRDHGGSVRYWRRGIDMRAVLCRDGRILVFGTRHRWFDTGLELRDILNDPAWKPESSSSLSGAVTRTSRAARRQQ